MKKILILNPYLATLGGGEKHVILLCVFFEEYFNDDVKIDILIFNTEKYNVFDEKSITIEDVTAQFGISLKNTNIRKLETDTIIGAGAEGGGTEGSFFEKRRIWHKIEKITKEYDLFLNSMFMSMHRGKAKKNVYICMFPPAKLKESIITSPVKAISSMMINRMFYNSYDFYMTNSQYTKQWLETFWGKKIKSTVVYPPVFTLTDVSSRYVESEKTNIILSVGRFFETAHNKKQLQMVRFFLEYEEEFRNYEFYLVGATSKTEEGQKYLDKVKRLAKKSERIIIKDNCPFEELTALYTKAKIFWHATGHGCSEQDHPEMMEHFGITTVEAMSYGAVPVVIKKGGQPEIVNNGENGFLWEREQECIDYTLQLMSNEDMRKKMAEAAIQRSRAFSVEESFKKTKEVFETLGI